MTGTQPSPIPRGVTTAANRYAPLIKGGSIVVIVISLALLLRRLPAASALDGLEGWVSGFGMFGAVVFGLIYVAASLLLLPAWALTVVAGALFGLTLGTLVVSLASTMAAGLAFAITRSLARERIARRLRHYPHFDAIDRAIGAGGWKIVALLRLSPAVPFTLQNYLYGLTGIRFWPCVLTSWLTMLPGTFLYVYLGHMGRVGVESASGERSRTPAEWTMLAVGLLATLAATVYITRLARRALRQRAANVEDIPAEPAVTGWPWGTTLVAIVAAALLSTAVFVHWRPDVLKSLFGYRRDPFPRFLLCRPFLSHSGTAWPITQHPDAKGK